MPPRVRKPRTERREEIARAALALIGRRGPAALTTTALAAEIGLSSGALFRHFASRAEILEEAVRLAAADVEDTFPPPGPPARERLGRLARARVALLTREPGHAWLLRSEQARLLLPPSAVARLAALVDRSRRFLRDAIGEAVAAGSLRDDVPPDVLLLVFTATVHALIGPPGLSGRATAARDSDPLLAGLFRLLAPCPAHPMENEACKPRTSRRTRR